MHGYLYMHHVHVFIAHLRLGLQRIAMRI
jgi:hypothetical protein